MKIINVCLLFLELKLNTKQGTTKERTHLLKKKKKKKKKNSELGDEKKMSKAINKLTVLTKRLFWEFTIYYKFTGKNNNKSKTNLPSPSPLSVKVFLIAEKLLSLWLWNFQTFCLFLLNVLWKTKRNTRFRSWHGYFEY